MNELVSFDSVTKRFGHTEALGDLSLTGTGGSVHAVTGENGAGKSTLMNLLAGVYHPDAGTIRLKGNPVKFENPAQARRAGISSIFQELTMLPNLTIAENLFLGREPHQGGMIERRIMRQKAKEALNLVKSKADVDAYCSELSVAEQQLVEIAKGMMAEADVFILDEPTAALNAPEVAILGELIQSLKAAGRDIPLLRYRIGAQGRAPRRDGSGRRHQSRAADFPHGWADTRPALSRSRGEEEMARQRHGSL